MAWAAAAPALIGAGSSIVGGMMSGKGKKEAPAPQVPPQLMPLLNAFTQAGQMGLGQLTNNGALGALFGSGMSNTMEQANTGFMPDFMKQLEQGLRPQVEQSFNQGAASLREQAALTGGLSGSGVQGQMKDLRAQLETGMMGQLANTFAGALPAAISARAGAASNMLGMPMQLIGMGGQAFGAPMFNQQYQTTGKGAAGQGLMGAAPMLASLGKR